MMQADYPSLQQYRHSFEAAEKETGIDKHVLMGVASRESRLVLTYISAIQSQLYVTNILFCKLEEAQPSKMDEEIMVKLMA